MGAWAIDCSGYLLNFGLHDALSAKVLTFVGAFFGIIYTLSLFTLAARACPPHVEGTIYGLFISAVGLAGTLGEKVGGSSVRLLRTAQRPFDRARLVRAERVGAGADPTRRPAHPAAARLGEKPGAAVGEAECDRLSGYNGRMNTPTLIIIVYAVLVSLGGVLGFVKAKSLPSLIGGEAGFVALAVAGYGLYRGQSWGLPLALVLSLALLVFFTVRYIRTRAFMPGGLMAILSLLALVGVSVTAHGRLKKDFSSGRENTGLGGIFAVY